MIGRMYSGGVGAMAVGYSVKIRVSREISKLCPANNKLQNDNEP